MECYLIHLEKPIGRCSHYLGYTSKTSLERFRQHQTNKGARLLQEANRLKIGYSIVKIWPNQGRLFERYMKCRGEHKKFCPICNPKHPSIEKVLQAFESSKIVQRLTYSL